MLDNAVVVKLSGKALGGVEELSKLFTACRGQKLVVVHGGGVEVDALFKALNLEVKKKNGLRVSPREQMPYISAALAGMCNKGLQALAIKNGLNALGMLASDGKTITVRQLSENLGMVGAVEPNDKKYLTLLLENGYTPIIASLAHDDNGDLYNVNADDAALAIARVLNAPLYYISDVPVIVQLVCDITFIFVNNLTFSFFKKKRGCGGEKETFFFTLPFASFPYQPLQIHCCPF